MIEILKQQFNNSMPAEEKTNRVREFLQILILKIMYDRGWLNNIAFVGGTALRLLYDLRRFSEDLDFSLVEEKNYDFGKMMQTIEAELRLNGLNAEVKPKQVKTVQSAFIKFTGLLKGAGLSALEDQKLSIKLDVDSNPPHGWNLQTSLLSKAYIINVKHLDLPSLYATKLHACFFRTYVKGRDFYDLLWYIGKKLLPNYTLLNNAIKQTQGYASNINDKETLKGFMLEKLKGIDFTKVKNDAERFLEDKNELKLLEYDTIKTAVGNL